MIFADNAKKYAAQGLYVFPVSPMGKIPLIPGGANAGSIDEAQIAEWSEVYPDANIGVDCGHSGLVVLDVDVNKGGLESLRELWKDPELRKALANTRTVKTGTGGYHFWFKARDGVKIKNSVGKDEHSKLGKGLDIRSEGGQVVSPPSVNAEGNPYVWHSKKPILEIPLELVAKLKVEKWTVSEKLSSEAIGEGGRNDYLMRAGCSMRAKGFEQEEIEAALLVMNQSRCSPPLDEDEVRQIAGSVARYERGEQLDNLVGELRRKAKEGNTRKGRKKLSIKSYDNVKEEKLDWLWYGRLAYSKFQLLVGLPGKTKSYLTCAIAAAVSKGEPLPGDYVNLNPEPHDVLLVTYEDGEGDTIKPRLRKCGADMTRIHTVEMEEQAFTVEDIAALEEVVLANPNIRLIIIDPVQNMMVGVDSNSDEQVRQALRPLTVLAAKHKIAILGIKHLNKNEKLSLDNRIGGSVGYTGLARLILLAGHDNTKEYGANHEVFAGVVQIKGNIAGATYGVLYEVNDNGLVWLGEDPTLNKTTADRLLPKAKDKKDK